MRCKALKFKKCLLQDEVSIGYVRETLHMLEYVVLQKSYGCSTCQTQLDVLSHTMSCLNPYFRTWSLNEQRLVAHGIIGAWLNENSICEWSLDWSILHWSCSKVEDKNLYIKKLFNVLDTCSITLITCEFYKFWWFIWWKIFWVKSLFGSKKMVIHHLVLITHHS